MQVLKQIKPQNRKFLLCKILAVITTIGICTIVTSAGWQDRMKEFVEAIVEYFGMIQKTASGVAAAAIAVCSLGIIGGNQKEKEVNWQRIKWIVIALVALWLLPLFIGFGREIVKDYKWNPAVPNA